MRIVIIEDELPSYEKLKSYVLKYDPSIDIVGNARSISDTEDYLSKYKIDLIFADIELLDGTVFEVDKELLNKAPVIFTTSYNEYLHQAFDSNGISYLTKPYSYDQFESAISKFKRLADSSLNNLISSEILTKHFKNYKERLPVKFKNELRILPIQDIKYIQLENGVIYAYTPEEAKYIVESRSLSDCIRELNPRNFFRINRNQIVHDRYIDSIQSFGKDRLAIKLKASQNSFISSTQRTPDLRKWIKFEF